ncbi:MAG TPA: biopolymer transporter ExbD [Hyphomonadaceae bacterium]|nr:biopolymer transporter ExbD [Hyphomonadaceae bacterium]
MAIQATVAKEGEPVSDINTTPLIDVMLVLLIMFIVTLPPQRHAVKLDTPTDSATRQIGRPDPVRILVDFDGSLSWNGEAITLAQLDQRLAVEARQPVQPEIHIEPNRAATYNHVIHVMAAAQRDGLTRIGVVGGT